MKRHCIAGDSPKRIFVIPPGFEPGTHSLEGCCSIQLSYGTLRDCKDSKKLLGGFFFLPFFGSYLSDVLVLHDDYPHDI